MMNRLKNKRDIWYFIIGLFVIIMLPVSILCTVWIKRNTREMRERNLEYWNLLAQEIAYDMDKAILEYDKLSMSALLQDNLLNILYKSDFNVSEYVDTYSWLQNQLLVELYLKESLVSSFQVLGNNGFFYSSDYETTYASIKHMTEEITRDGRIAIFMPYSDEGERDRDHVTIARYIFSYKDLKPLGYFMINLKTTELDRIWREKDLTDIRILVLDKDGNAIYGEPESPWEEEELPGEMTEQEGYFEGSERGDMLYVYKRSDYTGWTAVLAIPDSVYQEPVMRLSRLFLITAGIGVFLAAILAYFMIRRVYARQLEQQKAALDRNRAELKALQTQINPHFLYNTLGAINMYSVCEDSKAVQEITDALSKMFRYAVQNPLDPVMITDELQHVENYLKIQGYRLGVLPEVKIDIGGLENVQMLRLTLQPIIENVFKHAFVDGVCPEHRIIIHAMRDGDNLAVDVSDNGVGPSIDIESMEFVTDGEKGGRGIGLSNVHRRLKLAYGEEFGLKISGVKGKGMTIRICQPYITKEQCQ